MILMILKCQIKKIINNKNKMNKNQILRKTKAEYQQIKIKNKIKVDYPKHLVRELLKKVFSFTNHKEK